MNLEKRHFSGKKLLVFSTLLVAFCASCAVFAQTNSVKELKKDVQTLNDKSLSIKPADPWTIDHIVTPDELSKELASKKSKKPLIFHVGFEFLFKQAHIPGSIYAGPASKQAGIDKIKSEVKGIKHDQEIVIYCGCCPWTDCPNIRQAYSCFNDLGFTNVKVLYITDNFIKNWKNKGYPVAK